MLSDIAWQSPRAKPSNLKLRCHVSGYQVPAGADGCMDLKCSHCNGINSEFLDTTDPTRTRKK
jgi:phage FluMu protein Com